MLAVGRGAVIDPSTSSSTPNSTLPIVRLISIIVNPARWRTRGSHPSGSRSSSRNARRSSTMPPKTFRMNAALRCEADSQHGHEHENNHITEGRPGGSGE